MSAVDIQKDPQKNQSLVYQVYCNEREYHLERNLVVSLEEEANGKYLKSFMI